MKYCSMCGSQCSESVKYCEKCGHPFYTVQSTPEPQRISVDSTVHKDLTEATDDFQPSTETLWQYKQKTPQIQWLKFWTYFRLPFGLLTNIASLSALPSSAMVIFSAMIVAAIVGLHFRKLWGWKLNRVVLILECIFHPLSRTENISETELLGFLFVGWIVLGLAWGLPNFIYFKKRRFLFK